MHKIFSMEFILPLHNILRWAILIFGLWTVLNAITGLGGKRPYSNSDDKSNLLFMISFDIQLLLGFVLFFNGVWWQKLQNGMGEVMKNSHDRFFTVEHTLMMSIAWILVHVGRVAVKRAAPEKKHKKMLIFFGLALLLILASIPWPFREAIARPLFRGF